MRRSAAFCILVVTVIALLPVPCPGRSGKPGAPITVEEMRTLLETARKKHKLPALGVGIVRDKSEPFVVVVGVRKHGTEKAATKDDHWHLGSNTKPMTALLLALLIDMRLLDWHTPLEDIFPDPVKEWNADLKKVTPVHLLTHTSGLPANWPLSWRLIAGEGSPAEQRAGMMKKLGNVEMKHEPGAKYLYSNLGYSVLGAVIDRLGKSSWEETIEQNVFRPLGIKQAGFGPTGKRDALLQPWPHRENGDPVAKGGIMDNPSIMNPAGRVHMPIADYLRFLKETLRLARGEKGLLKPATAKLFFTNPLKKSPHSLSGWVGSRKPGGQRELTLRHNGSNTFNYCTAVVVPKQNLAICVCTNQGGDDVEEACIGIRNRLAKAVP